MTLKELPLFPLHTVLFPGMVLPLHIFEMRYRIMIDHCLQENKPFGVILIREGHEVGGPSVPFGMGTSAYVTHTERFPDGRMNIVSVGYQRFTLREIREDHPYQVGMVEDTPLPLGSKENIEILVKKFVPELRQYLAHLEDSGGTALELDSIPEDSHALAYLAAIILPLRPAEKQPLLEAHDVEAMIGMQRQIVGRELGFLRYGLGHDDSFESRPPTFVN